MVYAKMKIKTTDLIGRLETTKTEAEIAQAKAVKAYPGAQKEYCDAFRKEAARLATLKDSEILSDSKIRWPSVPTNPEDRRYSHKSQIDAIDKHLRVLKMVADESVGISPHDDLSYYL